MLNQILLNTPSWVWVLLLALIGLGLSQAVGRTASLQRITLLPLVMTGLSLFGTVSAFGVGSQLLLAWLATGGLVAALLLQRRLPDSIRYDAQTRRFTLPGSWLPLALILGIFLTKYVVGAASAMQPTLIRDPVFALALSALYGAFSGVFAGRAARLWRFARS